MCGGLVDFAVGIELVGLIDGQTVAYEFAHRLDVALRLTGQQLDVLSLLEADHLHIDAVSVLAVFGEALNVLLRMRMTISKHIRKKKMSMSSYRIRNQQILSRIHE